MPRKFASDVPRCMASFGSGEIAKSWRDATCRQSWSQAANFVATRPFVWQASDHSWELRMTEERPMLVGAATVFVVRNITESIEHYRDALGFTVRFQYGNPCF